jgi:2-amino-4-hydroxy-6-hydroxymethyldihydropteridine diphosphokinase
MAVVYLGLGSNAAPEDNLALAAREMRRRFKLREFSSVYRSKSLGFDGDDFFNAVACLETDKTPLELCNELEEIHDLAKRERDSDRFSSRTLDIDLLLYGQQVITEAPIRVPRSDVLEYSFVLRPLAEIAPDLVHPVTGNTISSHWSKFDATTHPLTRVAISL